jgi:hypothetical protein
MEINIVPQKEKLVVNNIDELTVDKLNTVEFSKHGSLLPNTVRCIISGPSNCGKTNVVFNLLTQPNGLHFNNIYVFSKSLKQPKYQLLEKVLSEVKEVSYFQFNANDNIMEPNQAKPYSVFVFDDVACENHTIMKAYFAMGRHNNIDSIYIGQTYSKIPKQLLRDNVNLLVVFKQDDTNLRHIYNDHVGADMSYIKFKELCGTAWSTRFGFLIICKEQPLNNGRYRIGFDQFVFLK